MLFRETVAVYCENHTGLTDTLCGQNAEYSNVKLCDTFSKQCFKLLNISLFKRQMPAEVT
jgi:hypothetical protein